MIESRGNIQNNYAGQGFTEDIIDSGRTTHVIRKFVNSAMYLEKTIDVMPTYRQGFASATPQCRMYKTRRCSCAINPRSCPCHFNELDSSSSSKTSTESSIIQSSTTPSSSLSSKTDICSPVVNGKKIDPKELKLPLSPLLSSRQDSDVPRVDEAKTQEAVKNWLAKKELQRKAKEREEIKIKEQREREKQELLEKERENFKRWLNNKKKEEERKRKLKEMEIEVQKLKDVEKEKRQVENELSYQLWLKKKEELSLDRKIQEEIRNIKLAEEKQKRLEENEKAFQEWLKISKFKAKPLKMNQGLESLKSSVSVAYINPIPWNSNIDLTSKPSSQ